MSLLLLMLFPSLRRSGTEEGSHHRGETRKAGLENPVLRNENTELWKPLLPDFFWAKRGFKIYLRLLKT